MFDITAFAIRALEEDSRMFTKHVVFPEKGKF